MIKEMELLIDSELIFIFFGAMTLTMSGKSTLMLANSKENGIQTVVVVLRESGI